MNYCGCNCRGEKDEDGEYCDPDEVCCGQLIAEGLASPGNCGTHCGPSCCDIEGVYTLKDGRKAYICCFMADHVGATEGYV